MMDDGMIIITGRAVLFCADRIDHVIGDGLYLVRSVFLAISWINNRCIGQGVRVSVCVVESLLRRGDDEGALA